MTLGGSAYTSKTRTVLFPKLFWTPSKKVPRTLREIQAQRLSTFQSTLEEKERGVSLKFPSSNFYPTERKEGAGNIKELSRKAAEGLPLN